MSWRRFLLNNAELKLFSFFMALLIWFSVRFSPGYESQRANNAFTRLTTRELLRVPVQVLGPVAGRTRSRIEPAEVDITVSGEIRLLRSLSQRDVLAFVDSRAEGTPSASTNQIRVYLPSGVTLLQVAPPRARLEPLAE